MRESDRQFAGSIPEIYDTLLVPLIFEFYAADLARRTAEGAPASVLETAAGSGAVTRALAPLLAPDARYVVTDLSQPMLDRARGRQGEDPRLTWQQADAQNLGFPDETFDAVCCQFGVMFFPERVAGYREAGRVLKTGGRFLFNAWDRIGENDFADIVNRTMKELFPDDPPVFMERTPHGYHDVARIRADSEAAGLRVLDISTVAATSHAASAHIAAQAFCQGTPLRSEIEQRAPARLEEITERAAHAIAQALGKGPVVGRISAHVATLVKPG
jgi:SAM-dependent methyltransferase